MRHGAISSEFYRVKLRGHPYSITTQCRKGPNARCQIGGADPLDPLLARYLARPARPHPPLHTRLVWTGLQEQIYRYTEHLGQPLRLGFADPALAAEDLGDAALGQNVPEVAWLQSLLLEQVVQHLVWLGFRQRMHAILVFLNQHAEHFEQPPLFLRDRRLRLLHQLDRKSQEPLVLLLRA